MQSILSHPIAHSVGVWVIASLPPSMNGIRRTLSFRKKKKKPETTDGSKPQQWLDDEAKIKEGCCSFHVKYLGTIEVYESRGMQVCEEAIRALRKSKKKPQKAILYVSGDALRVSDDVSQHLIVDQTIEKVSFCAPDRNHDKGFAYICRDGATRRWMCHAFLAVRESGERLSHAVGCAFAICLEKKQKRERDALQLASSEERPFVRSGSTRPASLMERLIDPQSAILPTPASGDGQDRSPACMSKSASPNSSTIARPRPTSSMLERQTSLRVFPKLQDASPFKRDLSLRLAELPSNLQRLARSPLNGHAIPEENGIEPEESLPSPKVNHSSQPSPGTQSALPHSGTSNIQPPAPPVQSAAPTNSVFDAAFTPSTTFVDPFSAAPFNPAAVPPAQATTTAPCINEVNGLAHLSISPQSTPPTVSRPTSSPPLFPPSVNPVTAHGNAPVQSYWPISAYPQIAPNYAYFPAPVTNCAPSFGYTPFSTNPYMVAAHPLAQPPTWTPHSNFSTQDWCPPLPSLLPPEPTRFSDPFDVGWTERAIAPVATSSTAIHHKSGNPFLSCPPEPQVSTTADERGVGDSGTASLPA